MRVLPLILTFVTDGVYLRADIKEVLLFPAMKPIENAPGVSSAVGPSGQL